MENTWRSKQFTKEKLGYTLDVDRLRGKKNSGGAVVASQNPIEHPPHYPSQSHRMLYIYML
jgi:hypothetical protein